jgi:hypothetical protein
VKRSIAAMRPRRSASRHRKSPDKPKLEGASCDAMSSGFSMGAPLTWLHPLHRMLHFSMSSDFIHCEQSLLPQIRENAASMMKPLSPHSTDLYRADIDGLRAFAVLSVVLYHAFPRVVTGGFVGVDVFFVISGFLISKILFTEMAEHRFSFTTFYGRRVRRIFPALAVCLAAVLAFGFVSLLPSELAQLGKHAFFGAAFLSNIVKAAISITPPA